MRQLGWLVMMTLALGCEPTPIPSARATANAARATANTSATANTLASAPPSAPKAPASSAKPVAKVATPPKGMVKVPGGIFLMGSRFNLGNPEEKPQHEVIVPAFYMDVTEVTHAAYNACVEAGACAKQHTKGRFCNTKFEGRDDHPANCVDLRMAAAYCEHVGKRLPTEREWEYAASGGSEHRRYSWGDSPAPTEKNNCYNHPGGSCPVKSFEPGAFGLYDMTGNVWEWTQSAFEPYPSHAEPDAIEEGRLYAYRGGSWSRRFAKWMQTRLRNRYKPDQFSAAIGIRCVEPIEPLECPASTAEKDGACVRTSGEPECEPEFVYDGTACVPDPKGKAAHLVGRWPPEKNPARLTLKAALPEGAEPADFDVTRTRTPQHDEDCKKNWPATPASYLFKGGPNYPSRKPILRAAGCVPRDMNSAWTSACCLR